MPKTYKTVLIVWLGFVTFMDLAVWANGRTDPETPNLIGMLFVSYFIFWMPLAGLLMFLALNEKGRTERKGVDLTKR